MRSRARLDVVTRRGTVRNGVIIVEGDPLPEGTSVFVDVEPPLLYCELDENGEMIMTPELEAEIAAGEAEIERGEFVTLDEMLERLRR